MEQANRYGCEVPTRTTSILRFSSKALKKALGIALLSFSLFLLWYVVFFLAGHYDPALHLLAVIASATFISTGDSTGVITRLAHI